MFAVSVYELFGFFGDLAQELIIIGPERLSFVVGDDHLPLVLFASVTPRNSFLVQVRERVGLVALKGLDAPLVGSDVRVLQPVGLVDVPRLERLDKLTLAARSGPKMRRDLHPDVPCAATKLQIVCQCHGGRVCETVSWVRLPLWKSNSGGRF